MIARFGSALFLFVFLNTALAALPPVEKAALVAFYNSTGGPSWTSNTNWLVGDPCENSWHGVECRFNRNVFWLRLTNNNLVGEIPPELGQLSRLIELHLGLNRLGGNIPPALGQLSNLEKLDIQSNRLVGSIPPELGQLSSLEEIFLQSNQLSGNIPPELGQLATLNRLTLAHNKLEGSIPPELGQLSSLEYMNFDGNDLTGHIPPELGQLTNLLRLELDSNDLSGSIPPELAQLSSLSRLYLHHNQLTGNIPPQLGQMSELTYLYLNDNQLNGSIPAELGQLSKLLDFYLSSNQLTGNIPPELGQCTALVGLYLDSNQLSGSIPPELGQLIKMSFLFLNSNQLTGNIPPELAGMKVLKRLMLQSNQLTGNIPPELAQMTLLQYLFVSFNQLSGNIPSMLGLLPELRYLRLESNRMKGDIPVELILLHDLRDLSIDYNGFWTNSPELGAFLDSVSSTDWRATQTLAPENFRATYIGVDSVSFGWDPVVFQAQPGDYRLSMLDEQTGLTRFGATSDKTVSSIMVTGLANGTYRFSITTRTFPHSLNINTVVSSPARQIRIEINGLEGGAGNSFPKMVRATDGKYANRVEITWQAVGGATIYRVFRCLNPGSSCGFPVGNPVGTIFRDSRGNSEQVYYYRVKACSDRACSRLSMADIGFTGPASGPPTGVYASDGAYEGRVQITWHEVGDASYYRVFRCLDRGNSCGASLASPSVTSFSDNRGNPEQVYFYRIRACDVATCSKFSMADSGYSLPTSGRPTGVIASDGTFEDFVRVSWTAVAGADFYKIYRCMDRGNSCGTPIGLPTDTTFNDSKGNHEQLFYYRIRACADGICSKFSVADGGYKGAATRPTGVIASDGVYEDYVQITWIGVEGTTEYRVFRCMDRGNSCGAPIGYPSDTSFNDSGGMTGQVYIYRVRACMESVCSKFSLADDGYRGPVVSAR